MTGFTKDTFSAEYQLAFRTATAETLYLATAKVTLGSVTDVARHRLLLGRTLAETTSIAFDTIVTLTKADVDATPTLYAAVESRATLMAAEPTALIAAFTVEQQGEGIAAIVTPTITSAPPPTPTPEPTLTPAPTRALTPSPAPAPASQVGVTVGGALGGLACAGLAALVLAKRRGKGILFDRGGGFVKRADGRRGVAVEACEIEMNANPVLEEMEKEEHGIDVSPTTVAADLSTREHGITENGRTQIFLSYARGDKSTPFARWIKVQLEGVGYKVWMDEEGIQGGADFMHAIGEAIENSAGVLAVIDTKFTTSTYCQNELAMAQSCGCKLFPVLFRDLTFAGMPSGLKYMLASINAVSFPSEKTDAAVLGKLLGEMRIGRDARGRSTSAAPPLAEAEHVGRTK